MRIGIDAGGTKTTAQLFDQNMKVIKTAESGFGNPLVNFEKAILNIETSIFTVLNETNTSLNTIELIAVGSAGASSGGYSEQIKQHLKNKFHTKIIVMSDLELSHIATFNNKEGILLIAGTGSSCLYRKNNLFIQKGGWGHILGDEGSAYWIGIQIIKQLMLHFEQSTLRDDAEILLPNLLNKYPSKQHIIELVYNSPKKEVAQLAQITELFPNSKYIQHFVTYNRIKSNFGGASTLLVVNGVLDVLFGAIVLFNVKAKFISMLLLGWLFALWFISSSLVRIFSARLLRPFSKLAYWTTMILNILCVIAGITMFFNPLGASLTVPFLIGFYFLMFGIERIISGFTATGI